MKDIFDTNRADIKFKLDVKNCEDSNRFLRKFYDTLSQKMTVSWMTWSIKKDTTIYIGEASFGEMWVSYKQKGMLDNVFISSKSDEIHNIVLQALEEAQLHRNTINNYDVTVTVKALYPQEDLILYVNGESVNGEKIPFCFMCMDDIEFCPTSDPGIANVTFKVKAFGEYDLKYVIVQRCHHLQSLLCAYTNSIYNVLPDIQVHPEEFRYTPNTWDSACTDWVDTDEIIRDGKIALDSDFFKLFRIVLEDDMYDERIRYTLNSAQELYCAVLMFFDVLESGTRNMPGYVDLVNTLTVSALEPLTGLMLGTSLPQRCSRCGNLIYSINKRVKTLARIYAPDIIVEMISTCYKERSAFLHDGSPFTNQFYSGTSVPLIDPRSGNHILSPASRVNINMFDWATYIFRHCVRDSLLCDQ